MYQEPRTAKEALRDADAKRVRSHPRRGSLMTQAEYDKRVAEIDRTTEELHQAGWSEDRVERWAERAMDRLDKRFLESA